MVEENLDILIISFVIILLALSTLIGVLMHIFNRKRLELLLKMREAEHKNAQMISDARRETQEQMLKNLSWELHDNIGQLLSVSKIQLSMMHLPDEPQQKKLLEDTIVLLGEVLDEVRNLSRSLNPNSILFVGVIKATELEISRLNRLKFLRASMKVEGKEFEIDKDHQLIIYRIIQEIITNVIKHAKATTFEIKFIFDNEFLNLICTDNGVGKDVSLPFEGLGIKNIKERCVFIGAEITFESIINNGVTIKMRYPNTLSNQQ